MSKKTPLLRNLILIQVVAIVTAIGAIGLTFFVASRVTFLKEVAAAKQKVEDSIREHQEKWRTWKHLGLNDALEEELRNHRGLLPIEEIEIRKISDISKSRSSEEVIIPKKILDGPNPDSISEPPYVVYVKLDIRQIRANRLPFQSGFALLGASGFLFIAIILFSARYLQRNIHRPIHELNEFFARLQLGDEFRVEQIEAKGEIQKFIRSVGTMYDQMKAHEKREAFVSVAKQVAHDIKSPLTALKIALDTLHNIPEEQRVLLRAASSRISDITNNLLERGRDRRESTDSTDPEYTASIENPTVEFLPALVDSLVSEKRWEFRSREGLVIDFSVAFEDRLDSFAAVQVTEFKRLLSNLINNAVDAIEGSGRIAVSLKREQDKVMLSVRDTGKGIPSDILPHLMEKGASFNKIGGNGLGLFHAKACINRWGGSIQIDSRKGVGTIVTVSLNASAPAPWFAKTLGLKLPTSIVVLDDDHSIYQIWKNRFSTVLQSYGILKKADFEVLYFTGTDTFLQWYQTGRSSTRQYLYLFDFELVGSAQSGLDLIEVLNLASESILVTNRFDENSVRIRCEKIDLKILPKPVAAYVPINVNDNLKIALERPKERFDAILVDDDPIVHSRWQMSEKQHNVKAIRFYGPNNFLNALSEIDPETPLCIDKNFGDEIDGIEVAKRAYAAGFRTIYLATEMKANHLETVPWITAVIGKEPPWETPSLSNTDISVCQTLVRRRLIPEGLA